MLKLFLKIGLLSLPVTLLIGSYLVFDPFKVIWPRQSYYEGGKVNYVNLNRNFTSTETFLKHAEERKFEAFIFGNSRSCFYRADDWAAKIGHDRIFHFDGWAEALWNILQKVRFLDQKGASLRQALFVFDYQVLKGVDDQKGHLFMSHPSMSQVSWYDFHLEFFKTYAFSDFRNAYLDLKISGKVKPYMTKELLINERSAHYILKYNEVQNIVDDQLIARNPDSFYNARRIKIFYERPDTIRFFKPVIQQLQKAILTELKSILDRQKTDYYIILSPNYDQRKLDPSDMQFLQELFGNQRVFDFSGPNRWTNDYRNYYETSHYRPNVARAILDSIYERPKIESSAH